MKPRQKKHYRFLEKPAPSAESTLLSLIANNIGTNYFTRTIRSYLKQKGNQLENVGQAIWILLSGNKYQAALALVNHCEKHPQFSDDINARDTDPQGMHQTLLIYAAYWKLPLLGYALLKAGADQTLKDDKGNTFKDYLVNGDVEAFIQQGLEVLQKNPRERANRTRRKIKRQTKQPAVKVDASKKENVEARNNQIFDDNDDDESMHENEEALRNQALDDNDDDIEVLNNLVFNIDDDDANMQEDEEVQSNPSLDDNDDDESVHENKLAQNNPALDDNDDDASGHENKLALSSQVFNIHGDDANMHEYEDSLRIVGFPDDVWNNFFEPNKVEKVMTNAEFFKLALEDDSTLVKTKEVLEAFPALANATNDKGCTILYAAVKADKIDLVRSLIETGAIVDTPYSIKKYTPLMLAIGSNLKPIAELLISASATVDAKNSNNSTALMIAAVNGHKDLVIYLLEKKADPTLKNLQNNTALTLAERECERTKDSAKKKIYAEIAELLTPKHSNTNNNASSTAIVMMSQQAQHAISAPSEADTWKRRYDALEKDHQNLQIKYLQLLGKYNEILPEVERKKQKIQ